MELDFPGIILGDRLFSREDLIPHSRRIIKRHIPEWERKIFEFILQFLDDNDYIEQQSSGTTGTPKLYKLPKSSLIESAKRTSEILNLKFGDKALLCLPMDYIAGKMMIVRAFVNGLNLFWEEPSSMPAIGKYGKLNFCAMVPLQVYNSFSNYEFVKNIENLIIGGSELRSELFAMFRDINNNTYETYGMAETCSHVALRKISGENPDKYFKAIIGVDFEVDERSCLIIKADYLQDTVKTNDVVELIDNKSFIWKGRFDNLINTGGIKVKPEELESEIEKVLDCDFAIIGTPDIELGQAITLVIESDKKVNNQEIINSLKEILTEHQLPRKICCISELPRNDAFKVDRVKLQKIIQ